MSRKKLLPPRDPVARELYAKRKGRTRHQRGRSRKSVITLKEGNAVSFAVDDDGAETVRADQMFLLEDFPAAGAHGFDGSVEP